MILSIFCIDKTLYSQSWINRLNPFSKVTIKVNDDDMRQLESLIGDAYYRSKRLNDLLVHFYDTLPIDRLSFSDFSPADQFGYPENPLRNKLWQLKLENVDKIVHVHYADPARPSLTTRLTPSGFRFRFGIYYYYDNKAFKKIGALWMEPGDRAGLYFDINLDRNIRPADQKSRELLRELEYNTALSEDFQK